MSFENPDPNDGQRMVKGSDIFVAELVKMGVDRIFYVAGEEILDIMESLKIKFEVTHTAPGGELNRPPPGAAHRPRRRLPGDVRPGALSFCNGAAHAHLAGCRW